MRAFQLSVRVLVASVLLTASSAAIVRANPCDADIDEQCGDVQPGTGSIASCIHDHMDELSHPCREHLKKMDKALRKIGDACSFDAREYCRDEKPGYGRIKNCLINNMDKLSQGCQDAVKS